MYGSIAEVKVKPGKAEALKAWGERWAAERGDKLPGYINTVILVEDADHDRLLLVAIFDSKASYHANAADPEMDRWYGEMRALLVADPIWHDGAIETARTLK